jgi:hypothetical protein
MDDERRAVVCCCCGSYESDGTHAMGTERDFPFCECEED